MSHTHHQPKNERNLLLAMLVTLSFAVIEAIGGWLSGSLALLADAGHMASDSIALGGAWYACRLAKRPPNEKRTYGFGRMQVLVAYTSGLALLATVAWLVLETVDRLHNPHAINGQMMLIVAILGLLCNLGVLWLLRGGEEHNVNVRGASLHVMGDLLGSLAAITAAILVITTGETWPDPVLSVLVGLLLVGASWRLIKDSAHILLEGSPAHFDEAALIEDLPNNINDVVAVHHVHAWILTENEPLITLHAVLNMGADVDAAVAAIHQRLSEKFHLHHVTVQVEFNECTGD
jgi:cobalt-zinc-cadmium efflux system protein